VERARAVALALLCSLCFGTLCVTARGQAAQRTVRVTIQAQAHFDQLASLALADGAVEVRARLVDDADVPLPEANVGVRLDRATEGVLLARCGASGDRGAAPGQTRPFTTDSEGRSCVRVTGSVPAGALELSFQGDALHSSTRIRIPLHAERLDPSLAFDSPALELSLDQPTHRLRLTLSNGDSGGAVPDIRLLMQEEDRELPLDATDWARSGAGLSFTLRSEQLGKPGPARLIARLTGSDGAVPTRAEAVALRVAVVRLEAELRGLDETGADIFISASTRAGIAASGRIEARIGDQAVGASPLVAGQARLRVGVPSPDAASIILHYRSDDPWWIADAPLELKLARRAAHETARWPWLVLLLPIGYFCLRALQRPAPRQAARARRPVPQGGAVRTESGPSSAGWIGTVTDAHDGRPIAGARVEAILPSLREATSRRVVITDATGRFELPALVQPMPEGAQLHVSSPLHTEVQRPLPPQGRVAVALMSRRRAVLRRLVRWARSMGPPWVRAGEPTPAQIADVAVRRGDLETARWAENVEAAAFGRAQVDQTLEAELRAQEPPWTRAASLVDDRRKD
jgi:hypothetical protein